MHLQDFVKNDVKWDMSQIAVDLDLSLEIQKILIDRGLLIPAIEEGFGLVSIAALKRFQKLRFCYEPGFLGKQTATELLDSDRQATRDSKTTASLQVKITQDTLLKTKPLQSNTLLAAEKYAVKAGTILNLTWFEIERGHLKIILADTSIEGGWTWYLFGEHAEVFEGSIKVHPKRDEIKLPVPYKSQRDNLYNPDGTCNLTSIAMCLEYLKIPRRQSEGQFEDELYQYALEKSLNRQKGDDLAQIVSDYGAKDRFTTKATIEQVKDWLANGNPAVVHGYFTSAIGHIIVLVGYDRKGFFVHDPYGEWFAESYDLNDPSGNNEKGKFLHYSYGLIEETCIPDGDFFVHFISR